MFWLYRQFGLVRDAICVRDTPRQMALGFACGMMLGLMPKGNLLAVVVATVLFGTRVSTAMGVLAAAVFSFLSPYYDPLTHWVGESVLTWPLLVPLWRWVSRLPFSAWTSFNNTVVMGNCVVGAAMFYPVYRLTLPWMARLRRMTAKREGEEDGKAASDDSVAASSVPGDTDSSMAAETGGAGARRGRRGQRRTAA
jgi:uncharacterized protein (TIGR03546 family)